MTFKDFVRTLVPTLILNLNRERKKKIRNKALLDQKSRGGSITKEDLIKDLKRIGIGNGDTLLVHSSLSRIGYLENGPNTLIDALIEVIGEEGNLLMPTSPNNVYQLNYIQNTPYFDVLNSPSKTGAITECFRTKKGVVRSLHPTEPVSAYGPKSEFFTKDHFNQITPYNENSPFFKVGKAKGKILYIGVTLSMAGTSLHTLEDAIEEFKFPVYYPHIFEFDVIDDKCVKHKVKTKVHNPEWSKKRVCDDLIPMFEKEGALEKVKIGEAETLLVKADTFFDVMLKKYKEEGITMYTPKGS